MKKNIHPKYQKVLFVDSSTGHKFLCGTTLQPEQKEVFEGKEYPVCYLPISSSSHPFFTGSSQLVDAEGRVEKFKSRYARAQKQAQEKNAAPEKKTPEKKTTQKKTANK